MKKLLVAVAAFAWSSAAVAGDYHIAQTLRCSQCHTMHASRQHQINGSGADAEYPIAAQGNPNRKLLIQDGTNETCLACHDAKAAIPDILGANDSAATFATTNARSAGALNGLVGSHTPGTATDAAGTAYADWMGHTLGSDLPPPGFVGIYEPTPQENFNCANCHAVHGSSAYRNLGRSQYMGLEGTVASATNPFINVGPTYNAKPSTAARPSTAFDPAKDVTIGVATRSYKTADVTFGVGTDSVVQGAGMNGYCAVCHGNFHSDGNTRDQIGGIDFVRHPTSGVKRLVGTNNGLLASGGETAQYGLVRPSWAAAPGITSEFQAACLSCHKGHGNARGYGLIYPSNVGTVSDFEQGDAALVDLGDGSGSQYPIRSLCITCHPMGRVYP
jgi:hypothetical protein